MEIAQGWLPKGMESINCLNLKSTHKSLKLQISIKITEFFKFLEQMFATQSNQKMKRSRKSSGDGFQGCDSDGNIFRDKFLAQLVRRRTIKNHVLHRFLEKDHKKILSLVGCTQEDLLSSYHEVSFDQITCPWKYISDNVLSSDPHSKFIKDIFESKNLIGKSG